MSGTYASLIWHSAYQKQQDKAIFKLDERDKNRTKTGQKQEMTNKKNTFKKGQSGNPAGRPKKSKEQYDLEVACRDKTPAAIDVICQIMDAGESEANKLRAAQYIIDRGYGKASETVNMKAEVSKKKELVGEELKEELKNRGLPEDIFEE